MFEKITALWGKTCNVCFVHTTDAKNTKKTEASVREEAVVPSIETERGEAIAQSKGHKNI